MVGSLSYLHGHLNPSHLLASNGVTEGLHGAPWCALCRPRVGWLSVRV